MGEGAAPGVLPLRGGRELWVGRGRCWGGLGLGDCAMVEGSEICWGRFGLTPDGVSGMD